MKPAGLNQTTVATLQRCWLRQSSLLSGAITGLSIAGDFEMRFVVFVWFSGFLATRAPINSVSQPGGETQYRDHGHRDAPEARSNTAKKFKDRCPERVLSRVRMAQQRTPPDRAVPFVGWAASPTGHTCRNSTRCLERPASRGSSLRRDRFSEKRLRVVGDRSGRRRTNVFPCRIMDESGSADRVAGCISRSPVSKRLIVTRPKLTFPGQAF